jgi:hypothetical protein
MTNRPVKPLDGLHAKQWTDPAAKSISHIARSWLERQIVTLPLIYQCPPISANRLIPLRRTVTFLTLSKKEKNKNKCNVIFRQDGWCFFSFLNNTAKIFSQFLCHLVSFFTSFPRLCHFACAPSCCKSLLQLRVYCFKTNHTTGIKIYRVGSNFLSHFSEHSPY